MRLKNIYVTCKDYIDNIEDISGATSASNASYTVVSGWKSFLDSYNTIINVDCIKEDIEALLECVPSIYRHQHSFTVTNAEWNRIKQAKDKLFNSMNSIIKLYESMGLCIEEETGIDIKLPQCNDFAEFKKNIEDLEFVLYKCPFFKIQDEELKFKSFDVGSMWLYFAIGGATLVGTSVLLNNIASFIDKCIIIKSHATTLKQQKILLQSMEMENAEKQSIINGLDALYKAQVKAEIDKLAKETNIKLENGEEIGYAEQSMERAKNLLDKGLEIYATIDSPQEVKALFGPIEMKYLSMAEEIKLLEKKEE